MAVEEVKKIKLLHTVISTDAILLITTSLRSAKVVHPTQVHS